MDARSRARCSSCSPFSLRSRCWACCWRALCGRRSSLARAAAEADARAQLKDELTSACWFMQALPGSDWVGAQLERAARTARALEPAPPHPVARARAGARCAGPGRSSRWLRCGRPLRSRLRAVGAPAPGRSARPSKNRCVRCARSPMPCPTAKRPASSSRRCRRSSTGEPARRSAARARASPGRRSSRSGSTRHPRAKRCTMRRRCCATSRAWKPWPKRSPDGDAQKAAELLGRMQEQVARGQPTKPPGAETGCRRGRGEIARTGAAGCERSHRAASRRPAPPEADEAGGGSVEKDRARAVRRPMQSTRPPRKCTGRAARGRTAHRADRRPLCRADGRQQPAFAGQRRHADGRRQHVPGRRGRRRKAGRTEQEGGTRAGDALGEAPPDPLLGARRAIASRRSSSARACPDRKAEGKDYDAWFYAESKEQKALAGWRNVPAALPLRAGASQEQRRHLHPSPSDRKGLFHESCARAPR